MFWNDPEGAEAILQVRARRSATTTASPTAFKPRTSLHKTTQTCIAHRLPGDEFQVRLAGSLASRLNETDRRDDHETTTQSVRNASYPVACVSALMKRAEQTESQTPSFLDFDTNSVIL